MDKKFIYFDNINTTLPDSKVIEKAQEVLSMKLGNPSSHIHSAGIAASRLIDDAREKVSSLVNSKPESIIFTSGATESNNLAIGGFLRANPTYKLALSKIEHFSILNQAQRFKRDGREVVVLDVDNDGLLNIEQLARTVKSGPCLVSISIANPEIGTVQGIDDIAAICKDNGAILHSDATSAGMLPLDFQKTSIGLLTLSGHNLYAPMGVGALCIRDDVRISPLFDGGNQERGYRPGTENLLGIACMGTACEIINANRTKWSEELKSLGNRLWKGLQEKVPFIHFTGHREKRLPGHVSFWVEHVEGESLLLFLNMKGVMAASGSACSSNLKGRDEEDLVASHVLSAVGVPSDICAGSITFSLGKYNTVAEVDYVISVMPEIVQKLLSMSPSYSDYMKSKESSNG
jgi:cysteine desulfurase